LLPASLLIAWMNFYPMVQAALLSLQAGQGAKLTYAGLRNYEYLLKDPIFRQAMANNFLFLLIQVPVMLVLALVLATLLNAPKLKLRGLFRTLIFLPCATSLVSYSIIFRALFDVNGFVNTMLIRAGTCQGASLASTAPLRPGGGDHRAHLALDRLQHGVLPGGAPVHRGHHLRGGPHRRGLLVPAVHADHDSAAPAHHPADGNPVHQRHAAAV
jgi:hypothetical protein